MADPATAASDQSVSEDTLGRDDPHTAVELSRDLLDATRRGEDVDVILNELAGLGEDALSPIREERSVALAFWINIYNAGTQILLDRYPERYESSLRVIRFFGTDCVTVGGEGLSLDDIEHGILRGSRSKYGLGYLPRIADAFERRYRLDTVDVRIHFALNCGAASCPAIRYYEPEDIDDQLDLAAETYLGETVEYNPDIGEVRLPRVFLWYRGDFDDPVTLCKEYGGLPSEADPTLRYQAWDWSLTERKFA